MTNLGRNKLGSINWLTGFNISNFLLNIVIGMYMLLTRDYVKTVLGYDYTFMTVLIASETLPSIVSVIGGSIGDIIGRKKVLGLSMLGMIPLGLMGILEISYLPILAGIYWAMNGISQSIIMGALLHATNSSGRSYGYFMTYATLGWGLGGPIAGYLVPITGIRTCFILVSIIYAISIIIALSVFPKTAIGGEADLKEVFLGIKTVAYVFFAGSLVLAGINLFFGNYSLRLRDIAGSPEVFGIMLTLLPAILGAIVRPIAGVLSDKINPLTVALIGSIMELACITTLYYSWGLLAILIWLIPAFPFLDQGYTMLLSRRLPGRLQALAAGIRVTMSSIGGLIVLMLAPTFISTNLFYILLTSALMIITSIILLIIAKYRRSRLVDPWLGL
ncbi:MAG: MFS transporter [Staphylothermus sp.]|nr:MFS transporter [Staphylothermus sp.]